MNILGISAHYHDSAAAILVNGELVAAAQEERFTRVKGDDRFPVNAVRYCLEEARLGLGQIDSVVYHEKPMLKFERILETYLQTAPRGLASFLLSMPPWLSRKLNMRKLLMKEFRAGFGSAPRQILFSEHHLSHAASAFYPSPFESAAVLCVDGVGEWSTTTAWRGDGARLTPLWSISYPHSLGLLYSAFTQYCGFKINSGEYKLMGLAAYGKPVYAKLIREKMIELRPDGSFWMEPKYFGHLGGLSATTPAFAGLFGRSARQADQPLEEFHRDLAASVQQVLEEAMLGLLRRLRADTGLKRVCLAGGVALNSVANGLAAREKIFDELWIQPAAGDAGGALGAALAVHYRDRARVHVAVDSMRGAFLGPSFGGEFVENALSGISYETLFDDTLSERVADLLAAGKIVGWFQGRMEYGPRALGARSILGNPLDPTMKEKLNAHVKFREEFRPFAPVVTEEAYDRYFTLAQKNEYMLLVSGLKDESLLPAITHVNGTARVQCVRKRNNPRLHALLEKFGEKTGHPVLINTSFNVRGEPLVLSPQDAVQCFANTDLDALVIENNLILKEKNPRLGREEGWHERFKLD